MAEQKNVLDIRIREIYDKVGCGYLILSSVAIMLGRGRHRQRGLLVECHNLQCGPRIGCSILEYERCDYRSAAADPANLYRRKGSG